MKTESMSAKQEAPSFALNATRILLVEDNPGDVRLVREMLRETRGMDLQAVGCLAAAVARVTAGGIDIVLLDLGLPDSRGPETLTALLPLCSAIPIVALTGLDDDTLALAAVQAGAQDYLSKNAVTPDILRRTLRHAIERKRVERALRESEQRFRVLFEQAADIILLLETTPEGIPMIRDANSATFRLLGYERNELIGQPVSFIDAPPDAPKTSGERRQDILSGTGSIVAARRRCKDGTIRDFECSVAEIQLGSETVGVSVERDITERKQLEEKFLRAQRLESIGALASGIAHDLNNILMPLGMGIEVLRNKLTATEDLGFLNIMQESVERGTGIIHQVLTFARGMKGERGQVQMRHLILDIVGLIKVTFPKTITVSTNIPRNLWTVTADATQLGQILMNLCVNARDAMSSNGALIIRAENHLVDEHLAEMNPGARPGPHVLLSMKDTGTGIPNEVLPHIFDPFFTTKEIGKGTGLGLATVHGIVKNHGGFITVLTEVGRGTEFQVYIPADMAEEMTVSVPHAASLPQGHGELVLVVDDEVAVAQIMKATLERNGYGVLLADDGAQAVAMFAEHKGDVRAVVMDVGLPVMDGVVTARALRRIVPALPILMMTGSPAKVGDLHGSNFPAVLKPFSQQTLLTMLREILDAKTAAPTMLR